MLGGDGAAIPRRRRVARPAIVDERQALPLGVLEAQREAAVPLENPAVRHTMLIEALQPPFQAVLAVDAQARARDAARAAAFRLDRPIEERQVRPRRALRIGIEQVVGADVVLIDRALDKPHAENLGVEASVLANRG